MSGQTDLPAQCPRDDGKEEAARTMTTTTTAIRCDTRPPALGQEQRQDTMGVERREAVVPPQYYVGADSDAGCYATIGRPESSCSLLSDRPTELCGASATPGSDQSPVEMFAPERPRALPTSQLRAHNVHYSYDAATRYESASKDCGGADSLTPPWKKWATTLHDLLHDAEGVLLFRKYLQSEGRQHSDALEFWFAVEGLHGQIAPETVGQLVKVIYRRYFIKSQLPIDKYMRDEVARRFKSAAADTQPRLFDEAQNYIENLIGQTTYPNFLKSDIYLQYLQLVQNPSRCAAGADGSPNYSGGDVSSGSSDCLSARDLPLSSGSNGGPLPTVHEDAELITDYYHHGMLSSGQKSPLFEPPRLTKDLLLQTQTRRAFEVRPRTETFAGVPPPWMSYHAAYSGYVPVSRVDSELQSASSHSDIRTDTDSISLADLSVDGSSQQKKRHELRKHKRQLNEQASMNRESESTLPHIPRTQRPPLEQQRPKSPMTFAAELTEKLKKLEEQQNIEERVKRNMFEVGVVSEDANSSIGTSATLVSGDSGAEVPAKVLAAAIKEKLQLDDDNDQDILDQHVSRVWKDLTPCRSPGVTTPAQVAAALPIFRAARRKERADVYSTFSSDSGNVMDYVEMSSSMVKSKSMGDYEERFNRAGPNRKSASKKTLNELTDSGVSVVSDTPPIGAMPKDGKVMSWLFTQRGVESPSSPTASRSHKKTHGHSRSSSLERGSTSSTAASLPLAASTLLIAPVTCRRGEPRQPFLTIPNMPLLPSPHTATQLEEARRRLESDTKLIKSRSSQSTMRRGATSGLSSAPQQATIYTMVTYNFCDEKLPYRTKIPGAVITLKQFKDYLPKRGNYRYFFKTGCAELGTQALLEEVMCDSDILPMWEGKIMAQVKPIE